ncbi:uncharacterized protein LOC116209202 [Punica granatum]|uniref:UspA domain-containing protein n=2 Tax=Punica granatum TaxID=22663 RepID=A0A218Y1D1_PUNGR|nr:uncharacterized protein LOC116209202 [Punica granatum]OWM91117.1 hypothetical protein CDL15_Pgr010147 [Punica granatum]PKI68271.1 hypothetical protein CRG98_011351 [Punica granatum]
MAAGNSPEPRKFVVVADSTRESAAALQYALSHGLTDEDELILLHIESTTSWRNTFSISTLFRRHSYHYNHNNRRHHHHHHIFHSQHHRRCHCHTSSTSISGTHEGEPSTREEGFSGGEADFLEEMKSLSEVAQPKVRVRIQKVGNKEGKDKASVILHQSELLGADVLIIGQRRSLSTAILGRSAEGSTRKKDTAEYLIKHSKCTCVGVQRKGQNEGYLLNTKTCRNFWLLA